MEEKKQTPGFPPISLPEDLVAKYSNVARISHTPSEIILDFSAMLPGVRPEILARIIMSPVGAKMFMVALADNLARFESNFGVFKFQTLNPIWRPICSSTSTHRINQKHPLRVRRSGSIFDYFRVCSPGI